jgi:hypothetical protein
MPDWDIVPPPASFTVAHEHKPVLYTAEGKALVRQSGFTAGDRHVQTTGTNPPLHDNTQRRPPKKGKR